MSTTRPCVASVAVTDTAGKPVQFTVGTDIVDHFESARLFGREQLADPDAHGRFQRRVICLPDRRGPVVSPMLLTLSSDGGLHLVRQDHASGAGWSSTPLLPPPTHPGGSRVRAVGAAATADDRIAIAVAVDDVSSGAHGSRVLLALDLSSAGTDWSAVPWVDRGARPASGDGAAAHQAAVEAIRVLDEGDGSWTIVLAGADGPNDAVYLLRSEDPARTFAEALVFTPAVTLDELLDFEAGVHPLVGSGLYVLGTSGGRRVLAFRPFPTYGRTGTMSNVPPVVLLPVRDRACVLETGLTTPDGTDVYVGGGGVQLIRAADQQDDADARVVDVIEAGAASGLVDLIVAEGEGLPSVWALGADGRLLVVRGIDRSTWGAPLHLRSHIVEMAPVGGDQHHTTAIVVVRGDGTTAQLWRDAWSGVWQETPILVADLADVTATTCYGTVVRVLDDAGLPQPGMTVRVTASVLSNVVLNGQDATLGPGVAAECMTDDNGAVSIYDRVRSLTPAIYRLAFVDLGRTLDVNPATTVHQRFREVTGEQIRTAVTTTLTGVESPLLPEAFTLGDRRGEVDALASALNLSATLTASTDGPAAGVRVVEGSTHSEAPFSSTLTSAAGAPGDGWGIHAGPAGVSELDPSAVSRLLKAPARPEVALAGLGDSGADFFEGLVHVAEGLVHQVQDGIRVVLHAVESAYEFVCEIAGRVWRWTLETLHQAGAFFTWLWDQVETAVEKVWEWLKFLVDWQDILRVRNAMVAAAGLAMDFVQGEVGAMKRAIGTGFDALLEQISSWRGDAGQQGLLVPAGGHPAAPGLSSTAHDVMGLLTAGGGDVLHLVTGNCVVGWVMQRLSDVLGQIVQFEGASPLERVADATRDFVGGVVAEELENLLASLAQIGADLTLLFEGRVPGAHGLSWESLGRTFAAVGEDALRGLVLGARSLVERALDLLGELVLSFRDTLFLRVRFPFVEKLADLVGWHLDTSFRFIDGVMLLVAVPATIAYKLAFGHAPLRQGDVLELPFGSVTAQSRSLLGGLLGLVGSFLKFAVASYRAGTTLVDLAVGRLATQSAASARLFQVAGVCFSTLGWIAEIWAVHHERGTAVAGIESAMVGVTGVSLLIASTLSKTEQRWGVDQDARRVQGALDLVLVIAHLGLRAADYGVLVSRDEESSPGPDDSVESAIFAEAVLDHVGAGLLDALVLAEDLTTRAALTIGAAGARSAALGIAIGRVVALSSAD